RRIGGTSDQAGKAACAAATAASTSAALPRRTRPVTAPVAGLVTSCWRVDWPALRAPPMWCAISVVMEVGSVRMEGMAIAAASVGIPAGPDKTGILNVLFNLMNNMLHEQPPPTRTLGPRALARRAAPAGQLHRRRGAPGREQGRREPAHRRAGAPGRHAAGATHHTQRAPDRGRPAPGGRHAARLRADRPELRAGA